MLLPVLRLAVLSSLIAGVVALAAPVPRLVAPAAPGLEPATVTALRVDGSGGVVVDVTVGSGGCTGADDFSVDVLAGADGPHLRVVRLRPDLCETFVPDGARLRLPVRGLDVTGAPVLVDNPRYVARR